MKHGEYVLRRFIGGPLDGTLHGVPPYSDGSLPQVWAYDDWPPSNSSWPIQAAVKVTVTRHLYRLTGEGHYELIKP